MVQGFIRSIDKASAIARLKIAVLLLEKLVATKAMAGDSRYGDMLNRENHTPNSAAKS